MSIREFGIENKEIVDSLVLNPTISIITIKNALIKPPFSKQTRKDSPFVCKVYAEYIYLVVRNNQMAINPQQHHAYHLFIKTREPAFVCGHGLPIKERGMCVMKRRIIC